MTKHFWKSGFAAASIGLLAVSPLVRADEAAPVEKPVVARKMTRAIKVRNVAPRILAWWLDPKNNAEPLEFYVPSPGIGTWRSEMPHSPYKGVAHELFQLPEGVDRIVAIDPQNALLVFGSEEGIEQLKKIVAFLDQPLKKVDIEAQIVALDFSQPDLWPLPLRKLLENPQAFLPEDKIAPQVLEQALKENRAQLVSKTTLHCINNLPLRVGFDGNITVTNRGTLTNGFFLTPTINNDDSVTVLLSPFNQWKKFTGGAPSISQGTQSILNLANEQVFWMKWPSFEHFANDQTPAPTVPKQFNKFVLLLTPRILRPDEEKIAPEKEKRVEVAGLAPNGIKLRR